jgi:CheY-like chemotaxis protein
VERLTSFRHRYGLEAGDVAISALADALRDAFRNGKTLLGRVTEGVLAVMQGDVTEEELAVRLERCLANLEFDRRLAPDVSSSLGLVLEASAIGLDGGQDVAARLDEALRARSREGRVRVTRASKAAGVQRLPVFLVENERRLREMLEYALANAGYAVRSFDDGAEALEALKGFVVRGRRPLVLLDIDLPGLDGFSILDELEQERPGVYKVVLMTPEDSERDQIRGLRSHAVDYVSKPVRIAVLLTKLERHAERDGPA